MYLKFSQTGKFVEKSRVDNFFHFFSILLQVSKTMLEQAVNWVPQIATRDWKPKVTLSFKKKYIVHSVKKNPLISSKQIKCNLTFDIAPSTNPKMLTKENLNKRNPIRVPKLSKKNVCLRTCAFT